MLKVDVNITIVRNEQLYSPMRITHVNKTTNPVYSAGFYVT